MATPDLRQRGILVFSIWAALGFLGLGFGLEGLARDSVMLSLIGTTLVVAAFVAHIIVNELFGQGFTKGEAALGVGVYGLLALVFIGGWIGGGMTRSGYVSGLALFGVLAVGFLAYLTTRYGLRGAFSRFHIHAPDAKESGR